MGNIKATAYLNHLTADVDEDHYLRINTLGTLYTPDIIQRMRDQEIATKNVDGEAFVIAFQKEMAKANAEGFNVVTGYCRGSLQTKGTVSPADFGHPLSVDRTELHVALNMGDFLLKAMKDLKITVNEQPAPTGPVIQTVSDPTEKVPNQVNVGGMVLIKGMRITLKGDHPSIGITFTKVDDGDDRPVIEAENGLLAANGDEVVVKPSQVYPNNPTNLQFILPAQVTAGKWKVTITTQASSSTKVLRKDPISYEFSNEITVNTRKL